MTPRWLPPLPQPPLRLVFMGTPELAATILASLLEGPDRVVGVFTRPDAARGRGLELSAPPVKQLAEAHGIAVAQPERWKDGAALDTLRSFAPDLAVVAAYGRLLPQTALDVPRFGCVNVHASLLPRWRGADPITHAIAAGDVETGVTIMQMALEMDAGDVLWQLPTPILPSDTGATLERRLAALGAGALAEALEAWRAGRLHATAQDPALVTFAPLVKKEDGRIDWTRPAVEIERAVRAHDPWPGCFTRRGDLPLKVWSSEVAERPAALAERPEPRGGGAAGAADSVKPGAVVAVDAAGVTVATGEGVLRLREVQAPGRRRIPAAEWARGARLAVGERLGA